MMTVTLKLVKRNNSLAWGTLLFSVILHVLIIVGMSLHSIQTKDATQLARQLARRSPAQVLWLVNPLPVSVTSSAKHLVKLPLAQSSPASTAPVLVNTVTTTIASIARSRATSPPHTANATAAHSRSALVANTISAVDEAATAAQPDSMMAAAASQPIGHQHSSVSSNVAIHHARPDYAYNPDPEYPMILREQGIGGTVWLQVWVDSEGLPGEIRVTQGSGVRLLDESASRAVRYWRFIPARRGKQQIASWVEFPIRFALEG